MVGFRVTWENDVFSNDAFDYFRSVFSCLSTWRPVFFHRAPRLREEEFSLADDDSDKANNRGGSTPPSINNFPPLESIFDSFRSTRYFAHPSAHPFQTRVSSQYSSQRHIKGSRLPFPEIRAVNEKGIDLRKRLRSAKGCVSEELLCAVP